MATTLAEMFGAGDLALAPAPTIDEIELREPRLTPPDTLAGICSTDPFERASHTYGKSFRDIVRGLSGDFSNPPDLVALPRDEADITALLDWATEVRAAAIPYGGGSSVVGGVECDVGDAYSGVVTIDLRHLDRVLEVDRESRAARIQGGVYGPALEGQLRPHDLTLRHYPQSFEFSTLGGWIVTRSGGHYATNHTHIEEFVESVRAVTPRGIWESARLPGSGAGPSPDRLLAGSEGILGVVTEAWMRLQDRPVHRASTSARFADWADGVAAARALAQSGLYPANCRLVEAPEALVMGAGDGSSHVLLVAFESADHPVGVSMARAVELVRDHGGEIDDDTIRIRDDSGDGAAEDRDESSASWRNSFIRAPYTRDALVRLGMVNETFETATTWDRFDALHDAVKAAARDALNEIGAPNGVITCRFTHVYADGPAPYFTVIAPGRHGSQLEQWATVKTAVSDVLADHGATITHHHAVGRDHRPWYGRQRPDLFADALLAAKAAVDPSAILNPGVLLDPVHDASTDTRRAGR